MDTHAIKITFRDPTLIYPVPQAALALGDDVYGSRKRPRSASEDYFLSSVEHKRYRHEDSVSTAVEVTPEDAISNNSDHEIRSFSPGSDNTHFADMSEADYSSSSSRDRSSSPQASLQPVLPSLDSYLHVELAGSVLAKLEAISPFTVLYAKLPLSVVQRFGQAPVADLALNGGLFGPVISLPDLGFGAFSIPDKNNWTSFKPVWEHVFFQPPEEETQALSFKTQADIFLNFTKSHNLNLETETTPKGGNFVTMVDVPYAPASSAISKRITDVNDSYKINLKPAMPHHTKNPQVFFKYTGPVADFLQGPPLSLEECMNSYTNMGEVPLNTRALYNKKCPQSHFINDQRTRASALRSADLHACQQQLQQLISMATEVASKGDDQNMGEILQAASALSSILVAKTSFEGQVQLDRALTTRFALRKEAFTNTLAVYRNLLKSDLIATTLAPEPELTKAAHTYATMPKEIQTFRGDREKRSIHKYPDNKGRHENSKSHKQRSYGSSSHKGKDSKDKGKSYKGSHNKYKGSGRRYSKNKPDRDNRLRDNSKPESSNTKQDQPSSSNKQ